MLPAFVTIVRGRHDHLRRQRAWIAVLNPASSSHVVVSMDDPHVADVVGEREACATRVVTIHGDPMPLAAARNVGVEAAVTTGATEVVLLDVDCLPSRTLVGDYELAELEVLQWSAAAGWQLATS